MFLTLEKGSHGPGNQTSEDEVSLAVYVGSGSVTIRSIAASGKNFHMRMRKRCYSDPDEAGSIKKNWEQKQI